MLKTARLLIYLDDLLTILLSIDLE